MNARLPFSRFALLDAAIVSTRHIRGIVDAGYTGICLYAPMGDDAAQISPWILPDVPVVSSFVDSLRADRTRAFGTTWLNVDRPLEQVVKHLQKLTYLHADGGHFFLRYADGRAFADIWGVLRDTQRQAFLGPIRVWDAFSHSAQCYEADPGIEAGKQSKGTLPLHLLPPQWRDLLRAQRDTQRWADWEQTYKLLAADYTPSELHRLSCRTGAWLRSQGVLPEAVIQAVGAAVLRSGGQVLSEPGITERVRRCEAEGDLSPLLAWAGAEAHGRQSLGGGVDA